MHKIEQQTNLQGLNAVVDNLQKHSESCINGELWEVDEARFWRTDPGGYCLALVYQTARSFTTEELQYPHTIPHCDCLSVVRPPFLPFIHQSLKSLMSKQRNLDETEWKTHLSRYPTSFVYAVSHWGLRASDASMAACPVHELVSPASSPSSHPITMR